MASVMSNEYQTYYSVLFMPSFVITLMCEFVFKPTITTIAELWWLKNLRKFSLYVADSLYYHRMWSFYHRSRPSPWKNPSGDYLRCRSFLLQAPFYRTSCRWHHWCSGLYDLQHPYCYPQRKLSDRCIHHHCSSYHSSIQTDGTEMGSYGRLPQLFLFLQSSVHPVYHHTDLCSSQTTKTDCRRILKHYKVKKPEKITVLTYSSLDSNLSRLS